MSAIYMQVFIKHIPESMICSRQLRNKSLICYDLLCQEWGATSWKHDCHGFCSKWDLVSTFSLNWFKNHVKSSLAELLELNQKTSSCQAGWPNPGSKHAKAGDQTLVCTFRRIPLSQEVLIVIYHDWTGWYKLKNVMQPIEITKKIITKIFGANIFGLPCQSWLTRLWRHLSAHSSFSRGFI